MSPSSPSLSIKPPQALKPQNINEAMLVVSTQYELLHEMVQTYHSEIQDIRKEVADIDSVVDDIDRRLVVEERDKKILMGVVVFVIPLLLTIIGYIYYQ